MKKIIYCLVILGLAITSCNPNEDIYNALDAQEDVIAGDVEYTLTDEDYDELEKSFGNFNSEDEAKSLIPGLLSSKFPVWGLGSSANVTFDLYAPKREEKSLIRYTVSSQDYDDLGHTFGNFDSDGDIQEFLEWKYPDPASRALVSLTYKYYDGSVNTLNNGFLYINDAWETILGFTDDEYEEMGEGFSNFSSEDEAIVKIPVFLKDKFKYDPREAGDIVATMYKLYTTDVDDIDGDGSTTDRTTYSYVKYFIFDGVNWSEYNDVISSTIQFGHDGTTWVPDNTIKYTFTADDVAFISDAFISIYEGPADNVGFFGSFDRRESSDNYWSDSMLLEAFNALLDERDPSAEEGQKYVLTFVVYTGSTGNETKSVIKTGGEWVYQ
ncbi:hypothetical protein [Jejuia spongiicola]|uniref:PAS domain-containing protein n=1 Tax=Jejuia spongiicola TaxID=2942207 RepID=A0ABT0Q9W8_9FLAO|nr:MULTISPECIES: hypothetical protein [Flavobacteriaceae]MCL6293728.1 hypothetical protein [Jejuia spongiicola]PIA78718.1 hypothetical protein BFR04_04065 [Gaetbulibacter sp. 4G1]